MPNNQFIEYNVDIVLCIDSTGSMTPVLDDVKRSALSFYDKFVRRMEEAEKPVGQLRIKVISFKDFFYDRNPIVESRFFTLDQDKEEFRDFVDKIQAGGGGGDFVNALEALATAMKSDWVSTGSKRRHVIMLWTDTRGLDFKERRSSSNYPSDMPEDLAELHEWWEGQWMDKKAKRLLIFAPDKWPWNEMQDWTSIFQKVSRAGCGCSDADIETCIRLLVGSI